MTILTLGTLWAIAMCIAKSPEGFENSRNLSLFLNEYHQLARPKKQFKKGEVERYRVGEAPWEVFYASEELFTCLKRINSNPFRFYSKISECGEFDEHHREALENWGLNQYSGLGFAAGPIRSVYIFLWSLAIMVALRYWGEWLLHGRRT